MGFELVSQDDFWCNIHCKSSPSLWRRRLRPQEKLGFCCVSRVSYIFVILGGHVPFTGWWTKWPIDGCVSA